MSEYSIELVSNSPAQTQWLGARLGEGLAGGEVICLEGDLGAGKTTFAQGIGRGLGIGAPIISPTFTLIREYRAPAGRPALFHIDFYRLDTAQDFATLGLDDYLYGEGVCVIEWAEKALTRLPGDRLWITLRFAGHETRRLELTATDERHLALLYQFREAITGGEQ